jgi:hypothetical protein
MSRYEGMDKLLEGVRERAQESTQNRPRRASSTSAAPMTSEQYDTIVGNLNNLLHAAGELREMVVAEESRFLPEGRREHLLMLLGQVLEELWNTEATLQGVS